MYIKDNNFKMFKTFTPKPKQMNMLQSTTKISLIALKHSRKCTYLTKNLIKNDFADISMCFALLYP